MRPLNVFEYEKLAHERLRPAVWDYYSAGANDEVSLRANCDRFDSIIRTTTRAAIRTTTTIATIATITVVLIVRREAELEGTIQA
jgi:isopentenyl diphosphate isomerase/L-lactate dehydrogenase-like FMN-dependent dehydrogenase